MKGAMEVPLIALATGKTAETHFVDNLNASAFDSRSNAMASATITAVSYTHLTLPTIYSV